MQPPKSKPVQTPNTFIIGAPKSGTSAMAVYLDAHPNVFLCAPKEPFFWSHDYPQLRTINDVTDQDKYLDLFADATDSHSVVCEGSTNYLASSVAVNSIMKFNPNAKFLVMLRNPVEVVHAFHSELLFSYIEAQPCFETAWGLQDQRALGHAIPANCIAPQFLQYRDVANYPDQLTRFFSAVPEANRKVILFDDFANDNDNTYKETLEFLGLSNFEMESFKRVNASHDHRFAQLSKLILDPPRPLKPVVDSVRKVARTFKGGWIDRAKQLLRKPTKRKPLSPSFRNQLCEFFANDIRKTSDLLNRDLSHWAASHNSFTS